VLLITRPIMNEVTPGEAAAVIGIAPVLNQVPLSESDGKSTLYTDALLMRTCKEKSPLNIGFSSPCKYIV